MKLNKDDKIGIIALSGNCDSKTVKSAKNFFEESGYRVELSKNIFSEKRYLAGEDEEKLSELYRFFEDDSIKLILCARGGYGAIRLVNKIDYNIIKNNPKPFWGYSDATALLLMFYKKCGFITYHSKMACTDFGDKNCFEETNIIKAKKIYRKGSAKGILWGGNLSTVVSLCGLDFIPDKDFIFFSEDINEPVYKIDKMFQQLINIEQFNKYCKGIVLGEFSETDNYDWLEDYFKELSENMKVPVVHTPLITHGENKVVIPIGKDAILENEILTI